MRYAFYGTLRRGEPNYRRFDGDKYFKFVGEERVSGLKMYNYLGAYPMVCWSTSSDDSIVVDVFDIEDKDIIYIISQMESNAGYYEDIIRGLRMFLVPSDTITQYGGLSEVEGGDWVNRKKDAK